MAATQKKTKTHALTLPFNADAEKVVLGAAMVKKDFVLEVVSTLDETDFYLGKHQLIYRAIKTLAERPEDIPIDVLAVAEELINFKELENVGGVAYLGECTETMVAPSTLKHYIGIVQDNSVLRSMLGCIRTIDEKYKTEEIENINDFILDSENAFNDSISRRHISSFVTTAEIATTIKDNLKTLQDDQTESKVIGLSTGYERLDNLIQGFQPNQMIVVAARPSVGKTAIALNFAYNAATKSKKAVAIFSAEMSKEELFKRFLAMSSNVSARDINSGNLRNAYDYAKVMHGMKTITDSKIYIDDTPSIKLADIVNKSTKLCATEPDLGLIIIDYLGLVTMGSKQKNADSRQEEVRKISLALKALARDLKIPVIAISQLNRNSEGRDSKRPMMSDLRDSGSIEQDADVVMLLHRGDYYDSSKKDGVYDAGNKKGAQLSNRDKFELAKQKKEQELGSSIPGSASYTEVIVAKNRNGQTGIARFFFFKDYVKFEEPPAEWEAAMADLAKED